MQTLTRLFSSRFHLTNAATPQKWKILKQMVFIPSAEVPLASGADLLPWPWFAVPRGRVARGNRPAPAETRFLHPGLPQLGFFFTNSAPPRDKRSKVQQTHTPRSWLSVFFFRGGEIQATRLLPSISQPESVCTMPINVIYTIPWSVCVHLREEENFSRSTALQNTPEWYQVTVFMVLGANVY